MFYPFSAYKNLFKISPQERKRTCFASSQLKIRLHIAYLSSTNMIRLLEMHNVRSYFEPLWIAMRSWTGSKFVHFYKKIRRKFLAGLTAAVFVLAQMMIPFTVSAESNDTETEENVTTEQTSDDEGGESGEGSSGEDDSGDAEKDPVVKNDPEEEESKNEKKEASGDGDTESENDAQAENDVSSTSDTGENTATGESGEKTATSTKNSEESDENDEDKKSEGEEEGSSSAETTGGGGSVQTGDAAASTNVLNIVNTNIFNSEGWILLLNMLFGLQGDLDVRDMEKTTTANGGGSCEEGESCGNGEGDTSVKNTNTATITNDVVVRANTGGNEVSGDGANIETGDAYAAANIVNIANTNIVDSNYLVLSINNLGDWFGDLVLPGKDFFANLLGESATGSTTITNENSADIENSASVEANTGDNTASSTASTTQTGDASASLNVVNQANMNLFGGKSVMLIFRIHGDWIGDVFSAPEGVAWQETENGLEVFGGLFDGQASGSSTIENANTATITNNVEVAALTGSNKVSGNEGSIGTGNAAAGANIVNLANNNVFGKNWILAVVNIFGNWNGNLAFGRPDLWIGGRAEVPAYYERGFEPGRPFKYTYTIANYGDADATDVQVTETLGEGLYFVRSDTGTHKDGEVHWSIPKIPAGKAVEVSYSAAVSDLIPYGDMRITNTATVSSHETDNDVSTNNERVDVLARKENYRENGKRQFTPDPDISITKTRVSPGRVAAGTEVSYKIVVENNGGSAYHSVLVDTITDSEGNKVYEQYWELDEIRPNEEITIEYDITFNEETPTDVYTNSAELHAVGRHASLDPFLGWYVDSPVAQAVVVVEGVDNHTTDDTEDGDVEVFDESETEDINLSAQEEDEPRKEDETIDEEDAVSMEELDKTLVSLTHALAELEGEIRRYRTHLEQ